MAESCGLLFSQRSNAHCANRLSNLQEDTETRKFDDIDIAMSTKCIQRAWQKVPASVAWLPFFAGLFSPHWHHDLKPKNFGDFLDTQTA